MTAEAPRSSWNPALMPDHEEPGTAPLSPVETSRPTTEEAKIIDTPSSPESLHKGTPLEPEPSSLDMAFGSQDHTDRDGGAWLESEQSLGNDAPSQDHSQPAPTRSSAPGSNAQHSSSMSFARTVSTELNFNDDDEGEWNISRTNTDPFKFMPVSDRTNSFPPVPPIATNADNEIDPPLPSAQALDVMSETDRDVDPEAVGYEFETLDSEHPRRHHSQSIGGEVQGFEGEASDARYEEGVPLIPHTEEGPTPAPALESSNPFEEDTNDDFYSQIQGSTAEISNIDTDVPRLERKSTMQVLGDLDADSPATQTGLEAAIAEEDENGDNDLVETEVSRPNGEAPQAKEGLDAKWQAAFGEDDEDDFLLEDSGAPDQIDSAAFLGSDDEGLLDDTEDDNTPAAPAPATHPPPSFSRQASGSNPYTPQGTSQSTASPYMPTPSPSTQGSPGYYYPPAPSTNVPPPTSLSRPSSASQNDSTRAQSFANRSKDGYASPYDLPTDLVGSMPKPRRKASAQQMRAPGPAAQPTPPPTRSASMYTAGAPPASNSRPPSSHGAQVASTVAQKASTPSLRNKSSFFEELPMSQKARPASRQSNRAPSPAQYAPPPGSTPPGPPPMAKPMPPPPVAEVNNTPPPTQVSSEIPNLVAPDKISPYASLQAPSTSVPPPSVSTRYSPAPAQPTSNGPPAPGGRYSAPPPVARQHSSYSPTGGAPILPHQPRTSSPLAHFEITNEKSHGAHHGEHSMSDRRSSSSSFEPRLNRVPSLPPTREVEEEEDQALGGKPQPESRYSPVPAAARQTPPPPTSLTGPPVASPPKRTTSNYAPQPQVQHQPSPPPPRPTQSQPLNTVPIRQVSEPASRSASAQSQKAPSVGKPNLPVPGRTHARAPSLTMNMVPPADGREQDLLQRWKGVPVFTWGIGGTVVKSFPKSIPRYAMNSSTPTISRTPGEIQVRNIKDVDPLTERLSKFPGPLKGKSKKKETVAWLAAGIETLEKELPDISFHSELSHEAKRAIERLLLWKILRVFIEFDGTLEGNAAVEKAVRDVLSPGIDTSEASGNAMFPGDPRLGTHATPITSMDSDGADIAAMEQIRLKLMKGDREAAVWAAADKRLWGHAMLIAQTVSPQLYKQVAQEFIRKEVNYSGHNNESMGALYKILSGNFDDCVDELVPSHARAGLQLISTQTTPGPAKGGLDGLDKWRETLSLVLSNRSSDDVQGLHALGNLLASYGRAEAAHICFLFSRAVSTFGGLDDTTANFVLVGSDHHSQSFQFAKDTEALQLSEVYEYGLSLSGSIAASGGSPHLAAYKFQHAITLAEYGLRDKALQYCDAIAAAMTSQTKRSPYYNAVLVSAIDDFMTRLKQAPREESNSWISKPSMNKVSDSMWNRFNKFVAGDEAESTSPGGAGDTENGPFGRIAAAPLVSSSPSTANFDIYGGGSQGYMPSPAPPATAASSRYAPVTSSQAPAPSSLYEPQPYEPGPYDPNPYAPAPPAVSNAASNEYPGAGYQSVPAPAQGSGISQLLNNNSSPGYAPPDFGSQSASMGPYSPSRSLPMSPSMLSPATTGAPEQTYGYTAPQTASMNADPPSNENDIGNGEGGFEPPSYQPYGYEPPSYQPNLENVGGDEDEEPKRKKKSFMDDDDGDMPVLKPQEKSKTEKDKENEEMFRKAAEEDAKRAAAQQANKKGWGFSGWFGGKKAEQQPAGADPNKPIRAKLGEASSFVYDPDLKRWVNKKPGADTPEPKTATPPPPRAGPRSVSGTPPPPSTGTPPPPLARSAPPPRSIPTPDQSFGLAKAPSQESLGVPLAPAMSRSISNNSNAGAPTGPPSAPPSRPTTSMSNASSIDDLISAAGPRKPGQKKARKSGRYVDVMAKN